MSMYYVYRHADLARAIEAGASLKDAIHILGDVPISADTPPLDYWVHPGGLLSIASTSEACVRLAGGHLHIVGDGPMALQVCGTDIPYGRVTLVGCSASDVDTVRKIGLLYEWDVEADSADLEAEDDGVDSPEHYTWLGGAIAAQGGPERTVDLESWDVLDAIAPDDPHVWNTLKYIARLGRKGGADRRIVDLRKARTYLDRAIIREERNDTE
nr:MAG TPA: nucelotide kinase [Caudoviricetes sp.]